MSSQAQEIKRIDHFCKKCEIILLSLTKHLNQLDGRIWSLTSDFPFVWLVFTEPGSQL